MRTRRSILLALALLFSAAASFYSLCWMYYVRLQPRVLLGIVRTVEPADGSLRVTVVQPDTGAADAGLEPGDRIVGVDGARSDVARELAIALHRAAPGDRLRLLVAREGWPEPREIQAEVRPRVSRAGAQEGLPRWLTSELLSLYPLPFLLVGVSVLLQRPDDRNAWLLALVFAGFISAAPLTPFEPRMHPWLATYLFTWSALFSSLLPAVFYWFFSTFPAASPLERRAPWIKYVLLAVGAAIALATAGTVLIAGHRVLTRFLNSPAFAGLTPEAIALITYSAAGQILGVTSLVMNAFGPPEIRRKVRVIVAGSLAGILPVAVAQTYAAVRGIPVEALPDGLWRTAVICLFLIPLSFAYAVVKHRVLEIPVLLRRSARYLLVRRGLVTLTALAVLGMTFVSAGMIGTLFGEEGAATAPISLIAGAVFGIALASAGGRALRGITSRIDRAFFRSAYDGRRILQELAERSRIVTDRAALAVLLERSLAEALHPSAAAILVRDAGGRFVRTGTPSGDAVPSSLDGEALAALKLPKDGVYVVESGGTDTAELLSQTCGFPAELVCVMQGRDEDVEGLILLGPRLSEEPYSGEDRELIGAVGVQAGVTLENIRLAETMAERMEEERRASRELEIARQVQAKLLPQKTPVLGTLECTGICVQARAVGGDYYDFLDLGPGRLGLVLADISGKGISAALLMASLQANLRGQYAQTSADLVRVLYSLNQIFYESTAPSHYATLFFGIYDEDTRRLQYANCGHLPPILRRAGGAIERLAATAPVVGLFDRWTCSSREIVLAPGDSLVIFSDGVTDALNDQGEEFGEDRLLEIVRDHEGGTAESLRRTIIDRVTGYASATPFDDLTLLVVSAR